jgi:hypothetical protein
VLEEVEKELSIYVDKVTDNIQHMNFKDGKELEDHRAKLNALIQNSLDHQIQKIQQDELGNRMGLLQIRLLLEAKDILAGVHQIRMLYAEFATQP